MGDDSDENTSVGLCLLTLGQISYTYLQLYLSIINGAESDDGDGSFPIFKEGNRVELSMVSGTFFAVLWKYVF